jgi:hypothetical protein
MRYLSAVAACALWACVPLIPWVLTGQRVLSFGLLVTVPFAWWFIWTRLTRRPESSSPSDIAEETKRRGLWKIKLGFLGLTCLTSLVVPVVLVTFVFDEPKVRNTLGNDSHLRSPSYRPAVKDPLAETAILAGCLLLYFGLPMLLYLAFCRSLPGAMTIGVFYVLVTAVMAGVLAWGYHHPKPRVMSHAVPTSAIVAVGQLVVLWIGMIVQLVLERLILWRRN